jgi:hypothetical protein
MGTRVRLTRSGGLAGLSMVASVDLDDLPAKKARKVRSALEGMDFEPPKRRRAAPAPFADGFQYDVEVDDGKKRSVTMRDPVDSAELQTLLEVLLPLAEPE